MSEFLLVRIDDRLLHGQVALGWRHALDPEAFLIVDDEVARDPLAIRLFEAALPEGLRLFVLDTERFFGRAALPGRTVLLLRGIATLERLSEGGFRPSEVNLGGLHHRVGALRLLDYLYLTDEDLAAARRLSRSGILLYAQDLPSSARRPLDDLLATGGGSA